MTSTGLFQPYPFCDSGTPILGAFILFFKTNKRNRHLGEQEKTTMSKKSRDPPSLEVRDEKIFKCKELLKQSFDLATPRSQLNPRICSKMFVQLVKTFL